MPRTKIQQHYFTREREGVFRTSEGFDTVAKSQGLGPDWIKSVLHPYCVYKAPKALLERGEKEDALFPESLSVFHADNGEMVISRSIYVGTDFTGQRSTSFTHQYVIPSDRKDDFIREPNRLFRIKEFQNAYDIRSGKTIPELDDIDYEGTISVSQQDWTLSKLGIDQSRFQELVYAVMASVGNKKKVFISLDTEVSSCAEDAKQLLEIIYRCLPYAIRRQLGFLTFNSEPEGKQHLHVIFVEKGSIRQQNRSLDRDFLFDFPNRRFVNTELVGQDRAFFDWVWSHRNDPERLKAWFDFCEEALQDSAGSSALELNTYARLCTLYEIEQGNDRLYEANRAGIMNSLLLYVNADTVSRKGKLNELFLRLVQKEAMDGDSRPTSEYVKCLLDYYKLAEEGAKALLLQCFVVFVQRIASQTHSEEGSDQGAWIFEQLLLNEALFAQVFRELNTRNPQAAEQYIAYRTSNADSVKALLEEVEFWLKHADFIVSLPIFAHEALKKIRQLLQAGRSGWISAGNELYRYFAQLPGREGRIMLEDFCGRMILEIRLEVLQRLIPSSITYEELVQLGYILDPIDQELKHSLDGSQKQSIELLATLYKVFSSKIGDTDEAVQALEKLGPVDLDRLQNTIKLMLEERIGPEHFGHIPYAFYGLTPRMASDYSSNYDYFSILEFVGSAARATDTLYDFLVWSCEDPRFLSGSGGLDPNYRAAIDKYFHLYDRRATRNKQVMARLLSADNRSFQALIRAIKLKQSGKLTRFFFVNRKKLLRTVLILLPIILLAAVLWTPVSLWIGSFGPPPVLVVEPLPAVSDTSARTLKAGLAKADPGVQIFVNGQYIANGSVDTIVTLHDGDNAFEFMAVNSNGKKSAAVRQTITYKAPAPIVTVAGLPEKTKTDTVTVKASATDSTDANPKIYINGQLAGEGTVSKSIRLQTGDNTVVVKAENNSGKMSDPVEKIIKYEPGK